MDTLRYFTPPLARKRQPSHARGSPRKTMAAVRPVEVNEKGHSVYRWSAEWPECCWWKADEHTLVLEEDEVDYTIEHAPNCCNNYAHMHNPFGQKTESRRTPYAQLGSVAKDDKELPMCCVNVPIKAVTTDRMILRPGRQGEVPECPPCVGCFLVEGGTAYEPWVDDMVQVLNERKVARGNVGQMKKAEQQEARVEELHKKMDAIMKHLNISYQGMPPLAELMER